MHGLVLFNPTPQPEVNVKKSVKVWPTVRTVFIIAAVGSLIANLLAGCGAPPTTLHLLPGEQRSFLVGGVIFTVNRTGENSGDLTAKNTNNNGVRLLVQRLDTAGVLLDKLYVGPGATYPTNGVVIQNGETLKFSVRIWKGNYIDLAWCAFTDESCYLGGDEITVIFE